MKFSLLSLPIAPAVVSLVSNVAQAKACHWGVNGTISVNHETTEFKELLGTNSKLAGINVKVSSRTKTVVWGSWNSWGTVRTNFNGYFTTSKTKNCEKRQI